MADEDQGEECGGPVGFSGGDDLLRQIIDSIPVMLTVYDPEVNVLLLNREFERVVGWSSADAARRPIMEACYPDPEYRERVARFMERCEGWMDVEMRTRDGERISTRWTNTRLPDDRRIGIGLDMRGQRRAEAALRESEARFRTIAEATPQLIWTARPDGRFDFFNARWREFTGLDSDSLGEATWWTLVHPDDGAMVAERWAEARREGQLYEAEYRLRHHGGGWRWVLGRALPLRDADGAITLWMGANTDIHGLKESERTRSLLLDELNHRVRNTLALVQSIAHQTFRRGAGPAAREAFQGRLEALAETHALLTRESWAHARLDQVAAAAMRGCGEESGRWSAEGPPILLPPKAAVTFALAFHELWTNAIKHGALSAPEGHVSVAWRLAGSDAPRLSLEWRERGGPAAQAPATRGFGMRMIERALAAELDASVEMRFEAEGLVCAVDAPLPNDCAARTGGAGC